MTLCARGGAVTPEMAARLAKYFGTSEQFWLNLQNAFSIHQYKEAREGTQRDSAFCSRRGDANR
jgi:plasmid maintenance system antidote protein VapI